MPTNLDNTPPATFNCLRLPDELWLRIFSYLSLEERVQVSYVCKKWTKLCKDSSFWRRVDFSLCNASRMTTDDTVRAIISYSTGTQIIDLSGENCEPITDQALDHVARFCPSLRQLKVTSRRISDHGLKLLARHCRHLEVLDFENCDKIGDRGIGAVAKGCPNLQVLSVAHCTKVSDKSIGAIARKCSRLRVLNVAGCRKVTDRGLVLLGRHCSTLHEINLEDTTEISVCGIDSLVRMTPTLTHVQLGIIQDSQSTIKASRIVANHCHNLKYISFRHDHSPRVQGGTRRIPKKKLGGFIDNVNTCMAG